MAMVSTFRELLRFIVLSLFSNFTTIIAVSSSIQLATAVAAAVSLIIIG